ncbi:septal ring lytic transglycosylase RlpA family protein [Leptolyngbya iicbica]|uniref:Probable endolytic peptidoglycan transglycosylase RlpA n=2 Tax=Cyanophyceae TaxID=3028117 RepID=A0A4Q7EGB7_9CYAN|nr:septal ring lytic transglycosylase RlpA family protein [Leptolyngbya sp. LK]RZM82914.1 septal ring lytic transglycosylase RlpA family protein [Leptolyngbya sp. LK]
MIQNLCRSLTVAAVVCATGAPLAASAEQTLGNAHANLQETLEVAVDQRDAATPEARSGDRNSARLTPEAAELSDLFRIAAHTLEGERIAILHIDNLPVLTFVDDLETDATTKAITTSDELVNRAEAVARAIDAFYQAGGDPHAIGVRWNDAAEEYALTLDGEDLVAINEAVRYVNPTGQLQTDALQAANRLRNLLGASEELTEVEGAPAPAAVAQTNWGVVSSFSGTASWYGPGFDGRSTASGERFNRHALTAAHRTLPFGTRVLVTNVSNNRQVVVRINDRGPYSHGRVIDLSEGAAREIGLHLAGVGTVRVEVLGN